MRFPRCAVFTEIYYSVSHDSTHKFPEIRLGDALLTVDFQGVGADVIAIHIEQQPVRTIESDVPCIRRAGDPSQ